MPQSVPVGGSGSGGSGLRLGSGNVNAKKRAREGAAAAPAAGGGNQGEVNCSVCGKGFLTSKALFGHMRSHPDRGWKGAHPPPSFKAEEEFADLRGGMNNQGGGQGGDQGGDGGGEREAAAAVEAGMKANEEANVAADAATDVAVERRNYRVPDLNKKNDG